MHLKPDELVDIAEGTRAEASVRHLAECDVCVGRLADLRAMMSAVVDVEVPEPSPIFWERLSDRVREAVAAEPLPRRSWRDVVWWPIGAVAPRVFIPISALAAAAVIVVAVGVASRTSSTRVPSATAPSGPEIETQQIVEDPYLGLVADMMADMPGDLDAETADEAGLTNDDSAEGAVPQLSSNELRELRRLLQEELANSGD